MSFTSIIATLPSFYLWLHPVVVKNDKNTKIIDLGVVWGVMELIWEVVTKPYSTLSLQKCINRGREGHEGGLELLHCYAGGIGTLFPPPLP